MLGATLATGLSGRSSFYGYSQPSGDFNASQRTAREACRKNRTRLQINALDAFVLGFENVLWDPSTKKLYDGVKESLSTTAMPFYIISETSPSDVSSALKEDAGVDIPADSPRLIQADDAAAKLSVLKQVNERPLAQDPSNTLHLVEADAALLAAAVGDKDLSKWQLYAATWTDKKLETTNIAPDRVRSATLLDFSELLRWGLLMGVNDGCQEYEDGRPAA